LFVIVINVRFMQHTPRKDITCVPQSFMTVTFIKILRVGDIFPFLV